MAGYGERMIVMAPTDKEIVQSIGFLKIEDGPISVYYEDFQLEQNNYGIDILHNDPIIVRSTESLTLTKDSNEKRLTDQLRMLTFIVVKWIEHNRIPGELVLHYELIQLRWDIKVVCKVYKK